MVSTHKAGGIDWKKLCAAMMGQLVKGLGADCIEKELKDFHREELGRLLEVSGADAKVDEFKRYGSARQLYTFNIDNAGAY